MTTRTPLVVLAWSLLAACGGDSTADFPIPTRYILTWTCASGDCSIPFPYTAYEQMVLRDAGEDTFEATFLGASCTAVTSCRLRTDRCESVAGDMVEQLVCSSLDACGADASLPGLVLCRDGSQMEAEPIAVLDPESGGQASYDLNVQIFL